MEFLRHRSIVPTQVFIDLSTGKDGKDGRGVIEKSHLEVGHFFFGCPLGGVGGWKVCVFFCHV